MRPTLDRPIALVGLMGAGKSTVARLLGERLGVAVADLDAMLEAEEGCTIPELFERAGESFFRRRESELLTLAIGAGVKVLACGGGVVLDAERRAALRERCRVVWLEVSPLEASRRVTPQGNRRPLLGGTPGCERLESLLRVRAALYEEVAEVRVLTDGRGPEQVADAVMAALSGTP